MVPSCDSISQILIVAMPNSGVFPTVRRPTGIGPTRLALNVYHRNHIASLTCVRVHLDPKQSTVGVLAQILDVDPSSTIKVYLNVSVPPLK